MITLVWLFLIAVGGFATYCTTVPRWLAIVAYGIVVAMTAFIGVQTGVNSWMNNKRICDLEEACDKPS